MSFLSRKRTPLGAIRLNHPGVAGFECAFCNYRVALRTSPNALGQWAKARGKIGAHVRERHPEKLTPRPKRWRCVECKAVWDPSQDPAGYIGENEHPAHCCRPMELIEET